jgi:hypothetical protein
MKPKAIRKRPSPRLTLEITEEIINVAVQRDSGHCVLAEAVKIAFPGAQHVAVDLQTIRFSDPKLRRRYIYLTPRIGQKALVDWDQGVRPQPFSLRLQGAHSIAMASNGRHAGGKTELIRKPGGGGGEHYQQLIRDGGKAPPIGALASGVTGKVPKGRRREFGLRSLDR